MRQTHLRMSYSLLLMILNQYSERMDIQLFKRPIWIALQIWDVDLTTPILNMQSVRLHVLPSLPDCDLTPQEVLDLKTNVRKALPNVITLPQHFGDNGYNVYGIGKIFHGGNERSQDNEKSFDGNWQYTQGSKKSYYEAGKSEKEDAWIAYGKPFWKALISLTDRGEVDDHTYTDGEMTLQTIDNLKELTRERKESGKPFFMAVGFKKPHLPFTAPDRFWQLYDDVDLGYSDYRGTRQIPEGSEWWTPPTKTTEVGMYKDFPKDGIKDPEFARNLVQGYYASVSYIDFLIGQILDELETLGQLDDTIIILWSDHGWHLGDHDGFWAKHSNFEQATRSPLLISYPDIPSKGTASEKVVELVDIYPTLCDLASIPYPNQPEGLELQGSSLVEVMAAPDAPWPNLAYSQMRVHNSTMGHSLRDPRYRLTAWYKRDNTKDEATQTDEIVLLELYDYKIDPDETRSFANDPAYADVLDRMLKQLDGGQGWRVNH